MPYADLEHLSILVNIASTQIGRISELPGCIGLRLGISQNMKHTNYISKQYFCNYLGLPRPKYLPLIARNGNLSGLGCLPGFVCLVF